jgi:hypothetical protein
MRQDVGMIIARGRDETGCWYDYCKREVVQDLQGEVGMVVAWG